MIQRRSRARSWCSHALAGLVLAAASGAAQAQDLTARFSDDATEDTVGVFLEVNPLFSGNPGRVTPGSAFAAAKYAMRPVTLSDGGATGPLHLSQSTVYGDGDLLEVYTVNGRRLSLPVSFPSGQTPAMLLVSGKASGESVLALRRGVVGSTPIETADEVLFRLGPFPGLAGHALAQYPFFLFPKAINQNRTVETTVDPVRHAERLGLACDVYVVAHRTPTEWASNNSLTDVTGTIETTTVNGTTVQENTLAAWNSPLDADAGLEYGKPYDVVYDFGQDGTLDPGDLIDGLEWGEAGFYAMESPLAAGPYSTSQFVFDDDNLFFTEGFDGGSSRSMNSHGIVVYPDPLPPGKLPLVTFSHGNTGVRSSFRGYLYLQQLLASYGFITASFDMFPAHVSLGIRWRGWLSNKNTERLILQTALQDDQGNPYPPMGGGVIDGKVDPDRIITSGHSRGGEGVIIQYQQVANPDIPAIRPPNGVLQGYDADSFLGIHTISQVTFLSEAQGSTPDDVPYLLYFGGADNDVCGCSSSVLPTIHYNRAFGEKAMSYLYGAGHGFYNEEWSCVCTGPIQMTRPEVEAASAAYLLPWVMRVTYGNVPATDFYTRQPDVFRPLGTEFIGADRPMVNLFRDADSKNNFVIDDFETNFSDDVSSSGMPVSFSINNHFEGLFLDTNPSGGYRNNEPDGGFWWETRGAIGQYNAARKNYTWEVLPEESDFSDDESLSWISCQQTGTSVNDPPVDKNFTVSLVDGDGVQSDINTAPYGTLEEPHDRENGWGAAFATLRIPIVDFEANGSGIDLKNIVEVRFRFGSDWGSEKARLGFDDLEVIRR